MRNIFLLLFVLFTPISFAQNSSSELSEKGKVMNYQQNRIVNSKSTSIVSKRKTRAPKQVGLNSNIKSKEKSRRRKSLRRNRVKASKNVNTDLSVSRKFKKRKSKQGKKIRKFKAPKHS